ncbi:hypothetical protein IFM89_016349 [Coptis chinensis]|uniref:Uncharacterized protein n=1 Tax=Coptis chinensis TaxID=261450 RepID=A0A835HHZ4_9MAGN|nr:hypothetical protein IFM89_016349 [Coptis chinensis]
MSKKALQKDVPWRATPTNANKPLPKIHHSPILRLPQNSNSLYALSVMKHPDPIGDGFAFEATLEAAGPDCLVPGQLTPIMLLGLKVWPINVDLKFIEPVGKELRNIGKTLSSCLLGPSLNPVLLLHQLRNWLPSMRIVWFMDSAVNLMNASFQDR